MAGIAEMAGRLGVETRNIAQFSEAVARMGITFDGLTLDEIARSLAQFLNVVGERGVDAPARFGAAVTELGNTMATTEATILDYARRIANVSRTANVATPALLAIGAAAGAAGLRAEAGGTAIQRTFEIMSRAVAHAGDDLKRFARIAGVSAADFATMWEQDATQAFEAFVIGLKRMQDDGANLTIVLDDLGITNVRLTRMLKSLAGQADILSDAIASATHEWEAQEALMRESELYLTSTRNKLKALWVEIVEVAIRLGDVLLPAIRWLVNLAREYLVPALQAVVDMFLGLPRPLQIATAAFIAFAAAIGPIILAIGSMIVAFSPFIGLIPGVTAAMTAAGTGGFAAAAGLTAAVTGLKSMLVAGALFIPKAAAIAAAVYGIAKAGSYFYGMVTDKAPDVAAFQSKLATPGFAADKIGATRGMLRSAFGGGTGGASGSVARAAGGRPAPLPMTESVQELIDLLSGSALRSGLADLVRAWDELPPSVQRSKVALTLLKEQAEGFRLIWSEIPQHIRDAIASLETAGDRLGFFGKGGAAPFGDFGMAFPGGLPQATQAIDFYEILTIKTEEAAEATRNVERAFGYLGTTLPETIQSVDLMAFRADIVNDALARMREEAEETRKAISRWFSTFARTFEHGAGIMEGFKSVGVQAMQDFVNAAVAGVEIVDGDVTTLATGFAGLAAQAKNMAQKIVAAFTWLAANPIVAGILAGLGALAWIFGSGGDDGPSEKELVIKGRLDMAQDQYDLLQNLLSADADRVSELPLSVRLEWADRPEDLAFLTGIQDDFVAIGLKASDATPLVELFWDAVESGDLETIGNLAELFVDINTKAEALTIHLPALKAAMTAFNDTGELDFAVVRAAIDAFSDADFITVELTGHLHGLVDAAERETNAFNGMVDSVERTTAAANYLGIELDLLGPKFQFDKATLDAHALADAIGLVAGTYDDLADAPEPVRAAIKGQVLDSIGQFQSMGQQIPASLRPIIDNMLTWNDLTADERQLLEDLGDEDFATPIDTAIRELIDAIYDLIGAMDDIPKTMKIVTRWEHEGRPPRFVDEVFDLGDFGTARVPVLAPGENDKFVVHGTAGLGPGGGIQVSHGGPTQTSHGDGFQHGSGWQDFGSGTPTVLHGLERVQTPSQAMREIVGAIDATARRIAQMKETSATQFERHRFPASVGGTLKSTMGMNNFWRNLGNIVGGPSRIVQENIGLGGSGRGGGPGYPYKLVYPGTVVPGHTTGGISGRRSGDAQFVPRDLTVNVRLPDGRVLARETVKNLPRELQRGWARALDGRRRPAPGSTGAGRAKPVERETERWRGYTRMRGRIGCGRADWSAAGSRSSCTRGMCRRMPTSSPTLGIRIRRSTRATGPRKAPTPTGS